MSIHAMHTGGFQAYTAVKLIRPVTIDHTKCGSANSTNFPMLMSFTDWKLRHISNGGLVNNLTNGYDIIFTSDSLGSTKLNWEVEYYNQTEGQLVVWVQIPTLSVTVNTVIYICYGDPTITTFQGGTAGAAWDTTFKGVWHFGSPSSLSVTDSTSNAIVGTLGGTTGTPSASSGQIYGAANYVLANNQRISMSNAALNFNGNISLSFWINPNSIPTSVNQSVISMCGTAGTVGQRSYSFYLQPTTANKIYIALGTVVIDLPGAITMSSTYTINSWNHFMITANGTNVIVYLNGSSVATVSNTTVATNTYTNGYIGNESTQYPFDGKIDEVRIATGARSQSWVTAEYNNQNSPSTFYSLGTPTINSFVYGALDPVTKGSAVALSGGNLTWSQSAVGTVKSTMSKSSGKWYTEVKNNAASNILNSIGFLKSGDSLTSYLGSTSNGYGWIANGAHAEGRIYNGPGAISGSPVMYYTTNDIIMLALDLDNGYLYWGVNGTWMNSSSPSTNTSPIVTGISGTWFFAMGDGASAGGVANFGSSAFTYTVPTGYNAGLYTNTPPPQFDSSNIGANLTLSNNAATVTSTGAGSVRLNTAFSHRKYFEFISTSSTSSMYVGVETAASSLSVYLGSDATGWGYLGSGGVTNNGTNSGSQASFTSSDVIGVAYDGNANKIQFYKNGIATGSPITVSGTIYPAFGASATGMSGIINVGMNAWIYPPPPGYSSIY